MFELPSHALLVGWLPYFTCLTFTSAFYHSCPVLEEASFYLFIVLLFFREQFKFVAFVSWQWAARLQGVLKR